MLRAFVGIVILIGFCFPSPTFAADSIVKSPKTSDQSSFVLSADDKHKTRKDAKVEKANSPPEEAPALRGQQYEEIHSSSWTQTAILQKLNKYASLIAAFATLFTAIVALYLGDWRSRLRKPKLKLYFSEKKQYPYFQTLAFEGYSQPIDFVGQIIYILKPGFNARVKIYNEGRSTAKNVQGRIEKIVLTDKADSRSSERFYHPTTIKWSGEQHWTPVDIAPKSPFFLDLFWSKNENVDEIVNFNNMRYRNEIDPDILRNIVERRISPPGEICWNVWVDTSFDRGIASQYDFQGEITMYFVINCDNCAPLRFEAWVDWSFDKWKQPDIRVSQGGRIINND